MRQVGAAFAAALGVGGALVFLNPVTADRPSFDVLYAGCDRIAAEKTCFLRSDPSDDGKPRRHELRLWTPEGPFDEVRVLWRGRALLAKTSVAAGGVSVKVAVPALSEDRPEGRLSFEVLDPGIGWRVWALSIRRDASAPIDPAIRKDPEALARWAEARRDAAAVEAKLLIARAAWSAGDAKKAAEVQAEAALLAQEVGEASLEARARFARTFMLSEILFAFDEAVRELGRVEPLERRVPEVAAYLPYYRSLIHFAAGDITSTLADLRQAGHYAEALQLTQLRHLVEERQATADLELGYYEPALAKHRRLLIRAAEHIGPCEEAQATTNLGWTKILMHEHGLRDAQTAHPEADLRRALELYASECDVHEGLKSVYLNLAFAALQAERPDQAERWLEQIKGQGLTGRDRTWIMETRTRIAMARGQTDEALALTAQLIATARAVAGSDNLYRAYMLAATVLTKLKRYDEALDARAKAEQALDSLAVGVPLVGARHSFLAARDENVRGLADLLVDQDRPAEALKAVRRARSRTLGWARVSQGLARLPPDDRRRWNALLGDYTRISRELDASMGADWTLAASELEKAQSRRAARKAQLVEILDQALGLLPAVPEKLEPEPGVLRLSWIHLRSSVFVVGQLGNDAFAESWDPKETTLPASVGKRLANATRVFLHPYGDLRNRALHMLTWDDRPLAAHRPTAYALDLSTGAPSNEPKSALMLIDPAQELAHGPAETQLVRDSLEAAGASVEQSEGDISDVRARLGAVDWFHFGGHGQWSPEDPMAGGLALANGTQLGIGDILVARGVPETVILTSCEAGRGAGKGGEAFGLAHAFLVAGARIVVAPNREVTDDEAFRFAKAFYSAEGSALARYQSAVQSLGLQATAFRAFVP